MADRRNLSALEQTEEESILIPIYHSVQPYQYEPTRSEDADSPQSESDSEVSDEETESDNPNDRVGNTLWCQCGQCVPMTTERESQCCRDIDLVDRLREDLDLHCITEHSGFEGNCLNEYVVETSFYEFLDNYGHVGDEEPIHELYRYVAYRRFTRWVWHRLGRGNRKVIPACAVNKIRQKWESENYRGFQYARHY